MSRFDKAAFAELLQRAKGDRSINQYGLHSDVDPGYISRLMRCRIDTAPSPDIIRRLAAKAYGGVGFEDLMYAAGHLTAAVDDATPLSDQAQIKKINERGEVVETREARNDIPPDILEELRALDVDTRSILFRSKKKLSPEGWRTVIEFIKWQLSQEEKKK